MSTAQTKDGVSGSSSSKNLWTTEECLDEWTKTPEQIQFVDASWRMGDGRDGRKEFEDGPRLPGAFHWDTGDMSTSGELFPEQNPLNLNFVFPPKWLVGAALEKMGVKAATTTLVVYGTEGTMFAPRAWYLLKHYYCGPVKILTGSLQDWMAKGGPVDETPLEDSIKARDLMVSRPRNEEEEQHPLVSPTAKDRLVDKEFVLEFLEAKKKGKQSVIIDARGGGFANGHIPGSLLVPATSLTLPEDRLKLKPKDELESILRDALGEDTLQKMKTDPTVLTCMAAVSLCTLALALDELGFPEPWVYDGSWSEWGSDPSTPKETGEAKA
jgi:thiosulfate/3-mercaptopyruvate sulfurtransferase